VTETTASSQNARAHKDPFDIPASGDFTRKSVRGGAANVFGQGVGMALQIGTTIVLARILASSACSRMLD
jgi:hypothetical protein